MPTTNAALRRAGTVIGGAAMLSTLMSTSAWAAGTQWPNCTFGQRGYTKWRMTEDVSAIIPYYGIWENRNGDLVDGPKDRAIAVEGPENFTIYGQGDAHWALRGIRVEDSGGVVQRGVRCTGDADLADTAYATLKSAPGNPTTLTLILPPPEVVGHVDPVGMPTP